MKAPKDDELQQRAGLVLLFAGIWGITVAWVTVLLWPFQPSSTLGWLLVILLGPPLFFGFKVLMELLVPTAQKDQVGRKRFSIVKTAVAILLYIVALGAIAWFKYTWCR